MATLEERRARKAAYQRGWMERNPERAREIRRESRRRTAEKRRAHDRAYYRQNAAARRAASKAYRDSHLDAARERERAWKAAHPRLMAGYRRDWMDELPTRAKAVRAAATANRRARLYEADGVLTYEVVLEIWRRQPACMDCGNGCGLDHVIPLSRGGSNTSGNLANRCHPCNARKGTKAIAA